MNMIRNLRFLVAAMLVAGFSQQALAIPIVVQDHPRVATDILGLDVLGTLYDVHFNNIADNTFFGNTVAATAARDAINAALNMSAADLVRIRNTAVSVNNFGVQDSGGSTVRGVSFSVAMNWQAFGSTVLAAPIAQFAPHVRLVSEPASTMLVLLGIAGLAARRLRKPGLRSRPA